MSYDPPLNDLQAKEGFRNFFLSFLFSTISIIVVLIAVLRINNSYAAISAVFGLYGSFFGIVSPESYINKNNRRIDFLNQPCAQKYFTYATVLKIIPILISIIFLLLSLTSAK
jgi:hypothetical protein